MANSRIIKFRAWYRGMMFHHVEHTTYADGSNGVTMLGNNPAYIGGRMFSPTDDDVELMQFTGLLDKNGCEIWEGDLVQRDHNIHPSAVEWDKDGYWLRNAVVGGGIDGIDTKRCMVIGNIYENQDLIGGVK